MIPRINRPSRLVGRPLISDPGTGASLVTEIDALCAPDAQGTALLQQASSRLNLSARAYHHVLKVARTIADLAGNKNILASHIAEAVQYRRMNRQD